MESAEKTIFYSFLLILLVFTPFSFKIYLNLILKCKLKLKLIFRKDPVDPESKDLIEKSIKYTSLEEIHSGKLAWNTIPRITPLWVGIQRNFNILNQLSVLYEFKEEFGHFPSLKELEIFSQFKDKFLTSKFFSTNFISKELCEYLC
jgi:hypothetical protein